MKVNNDIKKQQVQRRLSSVDALFRTLDSKIKMLEYFVNIKELSDEDTAEWSRRYGARENEVSVMIKLINALNRIIPMEKTAMDELENIKDKKIQDISKEDVEIIKRYLAKVRDEVKPAGVERIEIQDG